MLFVLDKSLAENIEDETVQEALNYIAMGRREGKHLIFSEHMNIMKAFADSNSLYEKDRAVYKNIYKKLAFKKTYYENLIRCVRIVADRNTEAIKWETNGQKKEIVIPAHFINDSSFIQKTILLCENLEDCEFYAKIAEAVNKGIIVSYEPQGGGGSTIGPVYESIQKNRNRFCLCVCDSDQKYPEGKIGKTAERILKIHKNNLLSEIIIIEVREAENLISTAILSENSDQNRIHFINLLEELEKSQLAEARKFIDFKKGIKGEDFFKIQEELKKNGKKIPKYWQEFLNKIKNDINEDCINQKKCINKKKNNPKNCGCIITNGMGDKILDDVVKFLKMQSSQKTAEMLCSLLKPYWREYGKLVAAWCCGSKHISF